MTETIKEMRKRHEKEIKDLQKNCKHPKKSWSDWGEEHWAPGHSSMFDTRRCGLCDEVVDTTQVCHSCKEKIFNGGHLTQTGRDEMAWECWDCAKNQKIFK